MGIKEMILNYARYNHWANKGLAQWLRMLDKKILYKETFSSFSSIDLTLRHMNQSQKFWLAIIAEIGITKPDETIASNDDIVLDDLLTSSRQMLIEIEAYTEEDLLKLLSSNDMVQCRYKFILHVINHNSYHRGQIVTMSHQLGVANNIPALDYEVFLWSEQLR